MQIWLYNAFFFIFLSIPTNGFSWTCEADIEPLRIGFTRLMFTEVNENDAKAAIRVWGKMLARDRGIPVEPEVTVFKNAEDILQSLLNKESDVVAISTIEYDMLRQKVDFMPIFLTVHNREIAEQYVMLVHRDGPVQSLSDLEGSHIQFHRHLRSSLAPIWLDTLLVQNGFKPIEAIAGEITRSAKLSKVLLPVFFRQADVCVVTRRGFETMTELNPQIGNVLKVVGSSDQMVPGMFAFRSDYAPSYRESLLQGIRELHTTPAGKQVLMVFMGDKIEEHSENSLSTALKLIETHKRLVRGNKSP